jgi:hypothetical protein
MTAAPFVVVLGVVVLAFLVDVLAAIEWLRGKLR